MIKGQSIKLTSTGHILHLQERSVLVTLRLVRFDSDVLQLGKRLERQPIASRADGERVRLAGLLHHHSGGDSLRGGLSVSRYLLCGCACMCLWCLCFHVCVCVCVCDG